MTLLTLQEAATQLRVSVRTVRREIGDGRLVAVQVRGRLLVEPGALQDYIAASRTQAPCPSDAKATAGKFASVQAAASALSNAFRPAPPAGTRRRSKLRCAGDLSSLRLVASTTRS